jgi:hypothetical protein
LQRESQWPLESSMNDNDPRFYIYILFICSNDYNLNGALKSNA